MIRTRREFLAALPLLAGSRLLRAQAPSASSAPVAPSVLRYGDASDMDSALDQMRVLREQLGAAAEGKLRLMRDAQGGYSVALVAPGTDAELDALAQQQNAFFQAVGIKPRSRAKKDEDLAKAAIETQQSYFRHAGVQGAQRVSSAGLKVIYNVRFGVPEDKLDDAKKLFTSLYDTLGDGAAKQLTITRALNGKYSVDYRALDDDAACKAALEKYEDVVDQLEIATDLVPEQDDDVVYNETAHLVEAEGGVEASTVPVLSAPGLQAALEAVLERLQVPGQRYAFHVVDVASGAKLASLNAKAARECASMVKPYVALALFIQLKNQGPDGPLKYDAALRSRVERSLRESNNEATNELFALLGGAPRVQQIIEAEYPGMLQNTQIKEPIPEGGRAYGNRSSAEDYGRFMTALFKHRFPRSEELLRIMALSLHSRLYRGATAVPEGTLQYNKTGSTNELIADEGILSARTVKGPRRAYFIIATVERDPPPEGKHRKGAHAKGGAQDAGYHAFQKQAGLLIRALSSEAFRQLTPVYGFAPAPPPPVSPLQTHVARKHLRTHGRTHPHHK